MMEKISKTKLFIIPIVISLFLIMLVNTASAFSLGVSPATLDFQIAPGSSVEKTITISTSNEDPLPISVSAESELKDWLTFKPRSGLSVKKGEPLKLKVKIKVPGDAVEKKYEDVITISAFVPVTTEEGAGSKIATGVAVKTSLEVSSRFKEKAGVSMGVIAIVVILVLLILASIIFWLRK